jgi:hypothetical protein
MVNINHRLYGFCAKCGGTKDIDTGYVHDHCKSPHVKGRFIGCAVCGKAWAETSRDYVCTDDLATKSVKS